MKKISGFGLFLVVLLFIAYFTVPSALQSGSGRPSPSEEVNGSSNNEGLVDNPTIGILQTTSHPALDEINQGIIDELAERGYVDGQTATIERQNAQGNQDNMKSMAESLINNGADITVGIATPAAQALAGVPSDKPVILGVITDPVAAGLIDSFEVPGGRITGTGHALPVEEQFDLMKQIQPNDIQTLGIIYSSSEDNTNNDVETAKALAAEAGYKVVEATITNTNDLSQVAQQLVGKVDAIWIPNDNVVASAMNTLIGITNDAGVPVYPAAETMVEDGGLASFAVSQYELGRLTGKVTADVLEGADPATYPIQLMTDDGTLMVNKKTADTLGINIPQNILDEAKIIE